MSVRAGVARAIGYLKWPEIAGLLVELTYDTEWAVRANAAKSILTQLDAHNLVSQVLISNDKYAREITMKALEQDMLRNQLILPRLAGDEFAEARNVLERDSIVLRERVRAMAS